MVIMYCRKSDDENVSTARMTLFTRNSRSIDNIPPTKAALEEHIKRATYQAGHIWGQSLQLQPQLPSPAEWGWEKSGKDFRPIWTMLPIAEKACLKLISCNCTKACKGNCKCFKRNPTAKPICTHLCKCGGTCYKT